MTDDEPDDVTDYSMLDAATRDLVAAPVTAPPTLAESVMRGVSTELRPSRRIRTGDTSWVTESAVASALRLVLDGDPAVVARRVRIEQGRTELRIWMSVEVSYEHFTRHGDELVRRRVIDAVRDLFGLRVDEVDLDIVDVFDARPGRRR